MPGPTKGLGIQVGDHVQYQDLEGAVVESLVVAVIRDSAARVIGFYPAKLNPLEPKIAVTIERIVQSFRSAPLSGEPEETEPPPASSSEALCECGCGKPAPIASAPDRARGIVQGKPLRFIRGHHLQRLAASKRIDLTNQQFGRLTAIRVLDQRSARWEVRCECGAVLSATWNQLRKGKTTSCGCDRAQHG